MYHTCAKALVAMSVECAGIWIDNSIAAVDIALGPTLFLCHSSMICTLEGRDICMVPWLIPVLIGQFLKD